jgi:membrane associated rhomboid family serine protease
MLFFFMFTGVVASLGSSLTGTPGVRIGASGAIMGLTGCAAGWGHRLGSQHGIRVRNHMLQWALYTMAYGVILQADNVAHGVGFAVGAILGLFCDERTRTMRAPLIDWVSTAVGFAFAGIGITAVLVPAVRGYMTLS